MENWFDESVAATYDQDCDDMCASAVLSETVDVLSELARRGLTPVASGPPTTRNGVPVLSPRAAGAPRVTMHQVNRLRDEP